MTPPASTPQLWPGLAGRIDGARHILPVRVYFEDTDFSGLAYHASYIRWCERGRSDWLRLLGVHHSELAAGAEPAAFVVRKLTIDYLKPARIDEVLEVVSSCTELTTATLTLAQEVRRDGVLLAKAEVLVVLVSAAGRPMRLPGKVREVFGGKRGRGSSARPPGPAAIRTKEELDAMGQKAAIAKPKKSAAYWI